MTGVLATAAAAKSGVATVLLPPPQAASTEVKNSARPRRSGWVGDNKGFISTPDSWARVEGARQNEADGEKWKQGST
jgi:hypothetical protein